MAGKRSDPVDKHVGSRVRMRRLALGMSQEDVAHWAGISFQQIQKYENGANRISAGRLQQLSAILQAPVSFFFEGAPQLGGKARSRGESPAYAYVTDFFANAEGHALARAFLDLKTAAIRRSIIRLVETLAARGF